MVARSAFLDRACSDTMMYVVQTWSVAVRYSCLNPVNPTFDLVGQPRNSSSRQRQSRGYASPCMQPETRSAEGLKVETRNSSGMISMKRMAALDSGLPVLSGIEI